jgi:glycosyltransferase involved in cell wall biosynthesis
MEKPEVIWHAPAYDPSGYATCARDYIFALHRLGVRVRYEPVRFWSPIGKKAVSGKELEILEKLEKVQVSTAAPKVHHCVPDCYKRSMDPSRPNIGYTVFETDGCPKSWIKIMERMNLIMVPCEFNRGTFAKAGFDPNKMRIIPHIVDTDRFDPSKYKPMRIPQKRDFYFLTIMDVTYRKGWDILLRAYLREFRGDRRVCLIFKGYFGGVTEQHKANLYGRLKAFKEALRIKNPPDVLFYGDILDLNELPRLYKAADCYVLPSRGEGWGLPYSEAMSMELPTIGTGWGGNTEFMNKENSYLIDVLEFRDTGDELTKITPNYVGQKFAEPSEEHLRRLMRHVYEHRDEAKAKGKKARQDLVTNFSWKPIGERIIKVLKEDF